MERISIMARAAAERPREAGKTFEENYPDYPFAELVRLGLGLARRTAVLRRKLGAERPRAEANALKGPAARPGPETIPSLPGALLTVVWVLPL